MPTDPADARRPAPTTDPRAGKRPLCLFHQNCLDGSASAAVVRRREGEVECLPIQYGHRPPVVEGRKVYIVDFGFPIDEMRTLKAQASELIWIDHHASQQGIRDRLGWGEFDTAECGATLCWRVLFPDEALPPLLEYIRDKDLWQWRLANSRAVAAGLQATFGNDKFTGILDANIEAMAAKGLPLLTAQAARVAEAVAKGVLVERPYGLDGRALVVFTKRDANELGEAITLPIEAGGLGHDLAVLVYRKPDGAWVHSMRANGNFDCGVVAARMGGGGHPNSACYLAPAPLVPPPG